MAGELERIDINAMFARIPDKQIKQLDWVEIFRLRMEADRDTRADERLLERTRRADRVRFVLFAAVLGLIVLEFLVGAAIMVWAAKDWDDVKDLLAYALAPFAAVAGAAAAYYYSTSSSD